MTSIELNNPSAFHPLRVSSQVRARNVTAATPAAPAPKRHTREELERIGSEPVLEPHRCVVRENGVTKTVTREVQTPFYRTAGYESLTQFCTEQSEKELREQQRYLAQSALTGPVGERVLDVWGALTPKQSIPPGGKATIALEEHTRLAVSCDEEVTLQIANTNPSRTLRLRTLDTASGETAHCAWIPPAKDYSAAAIVTANGKQAAVIELQPS